jgi:hypothetical protein
MIHSVIDQPITGGNMNLRPTHLLSLFAAASVGLAVPAVANAVPAAEGPVVNAIGLTTEQHLVTFDVSDPWTTQDLGEITGLAEEEDIVGIDYRVQDGLLYGLGNDGGVYSFEGVVATLVSELTEDLDGAYFGVDFNPVSGLLRIVSDTGQNLVHDLELDTPEVDGATEAQTVLHYVDPADPALGVSAVAYTNNLAGSTETALYDIDTNLNQTATQSLTVPGLLTLVGALGLDPAENAGFDIHSTLDENRGGVTNKGYAALQVNGIFGLWGIDLETGAAVEVCDFPDELQVTDLAVQLAAAPE